MKKVYLFLFLVFSILILQGVNLHAKNAKQIIIQSENAVRGKTQIAIIEITIKTRRWTRKMKMKSYENRKQKKSFTEITAPKKDAGNRFLLIKKTMRHYVPKLSRVIKISPSMMLQSWMGSDFSNDDIVKQSSIIEDYTHTLVTEEVINGHKCYKVQLDPKPNAAVVWGKIIYYARVKDSLPVRQEYYNERGIKKRVMDFSKFRKVHDRVIPTLYKMQTVSKRDRYTLMEIKNAKFNIRIPAKMFTLQNLKRR
jgi:outer membrane lipoprotein-sorting protein